MEKPHLRVVEGGSMDKQKALEAALAQIDKHFGKGSIMRLGANERLIEIEAVSTALHPKSPIGSTPNAVALSVDEKTLYIANSDPQKAIWMAYEVQPDGSLKNGRVFFDATSKVSEQMPGLPDGSNATLNR